MKKLLILFISLFYSLGLRQASAEYPSRFESNYDVCMINRSLSPDLNELYKIFYERTQTICRLCSLIFEIEKEPSLITKKSILGKGKFKYEKLLRKYSIEPAYDIDLKEKLLFALKDALSFLEQELLAYFFKILNRDLVVYNFFTDKTLEIDDKRQYIEEAMKIKPLKLHGYHIKTFLLYFEKNFDKIFKDML